MKPAPSGSKQISVRPTVRLLLPIAVALAAYYLFPIRWWEIRVLLAFG